MHTSKYQNVLEMPQLSADWPGHTLRGPKWPKVSQTGFSQDIWTRHGEKGQLEANLALQRPLQVITNMIMAVSESHFGLQISQPPNITQKW